MLVFQGWCADVSGFYVALSRLVLSLYFGVDVMCVFLGLCYVCVSRFVLCACLNVGVVCVSRLVLCVCF